MVISAKYLIFFYGLFLIFLWLYGTPVSRRAAVYSCIGAIVALGLAHIPGLFFFRPRPFVSHKVSVLVARASDTSFPSDHATASTSLAGEIMKGSRILGYISWIMALLIWFARVFVGVHYPTDVLMGISIGLIVSFGLKATETYTVPFVDCLIARVSRQQ